MLGFSAAHVDRDAEEGDTDEETFGLTAKIGSPNQADMVKLLIEHGADVNAKARDGTTALGNARSFGWSEVAALLEQAGATE